MNLARILGHLATTPLVLALSIYDVCKLPEFASIDAKAQEWFLSCEQSFSQNAKLDYRVPQDWASLDFYTFSLLLGHLDKLVVYAIRHPESVSVKGSGSIVRSYKSKHLYATGKILMYLLEMKLTDTGHLRSLALHKIRPASAEDTIRLMIARSRFNALQRSFATVLKLNAGKAVLSNGEKHWMKLRHRVFVRKQLIEDLIGTGLEASATVRTNQAIEVLTEERFADLICHLENNFKSLQKLFSELGELARKPLGADSANVQYSYENFDFSWVMCFPFVETFAFRLESRAGPDALTPRLVLVGEWIDRFHAFLKLECLRLQFSLTTLNINQLTRSQYRGLDVYHKGRLQINAAQLGVVSQQLSSCVNRLQQTFENAKDCQAFTAAISTVTNSLFPMIELGALLERASRSVQSLTKHLVGHFKIQDLSKTPSKKASKTATDSAASLVPALASIQQILELSRQQLSDSELDRFLIMFLGLDSLSLFLVSAKTFFDAVGSQAYDFSNFLPFEPLPAVIMEVEGVPPADPISEDKAEAQSPQ